MKKETKKQQQERFEEIKGYTIEVLRKFQMSEDLLDDLIKINLGL
jgi:hypothetical protein